MNVGVLWCLLAVLSCCSAGKWRWPDHETAASVRIDTKVRFVESDDDKDTGDKKIRHMWSDEVPFKEPEETEGFYNQPPGAGRYPVRVEAYRTPYRIDGAAIYRVNDKQNSGSDGTLDSLQYCKCVTTPDCNPKPDTTGACGVGQYLCCYKQANRVPARNNEFFNEVEDERPMLLPGRENIARPFPPPPASALNGLFGPFGPGHDHDSSHIGIFEKPLGVLVGPDGPSGAIGPQNKPQNPSVLVGPNGPTGVIGPTDQRKDGVRSETAQRGVLVGPAGPTGLVGPYGHRPVLVGPGGPTGIIGPSRGNRFTNVLVGPGGPTGLIGPGYTRQRMPGILTGPGGPTGSIGPGRQILVGPSGPTGQIGPQGYFGK